MGDACAPRQGAAAVRCFRCTPTATAGLLRTVGGNGPFSAYHAKPAHGQSRPCCVSCDPVYGTRLRSTCSDAVFTGFKGTLARVIDACRLKSHARPISRRTGALAHVLRSRCQVNVAGAEGPFRDALEAGHIHGCSCLVNVPAEYLYLWVLNVACTYHE